MVKTSLSTKLGKKGFYYILPWILGFLIFQAVPIIYAFIISLSKWDFLTERTFVGMKNYLDLLHDRKFGIAISNTFMFMFVGNGLGIAISLFLASIMYEKVPGRNVFRVIFFMPQLVVPVAFGLMMVPIFGAEKYGLINVFLEAMGLHSVRWLENPPVTRWVVVLLNLWFIGGSVVIFLAGIAGQPRSYYEAAQIDGAGWWRRFFCVTVPLLRPVIFFQVIMGLIGGLQIFDVPAALSRMGSGLSTVMGKNDSLATLVYYLYISGFRRWQAGYAAAIGWVLFFIGFMLTFVIVFFMRRQQKEHAGI